MVREGNLLGWVFLNCIKIEMAKNIIVSENISLCKSQAVLRTGICTITNNESGTAERLLFLIIAFPNEKTDTAKRPKTRVANVETVVCD